MNPAQKAKYFRHLWPAACGAQGWDPRDDARRHACTLYATGEESTSLLTQHKITALFTFLAHLADPRDGEKARQWDLCRRDATAFNHARQAEHWRRRAGYKATGKLNRERFGAMFEEEISPAHMTAEQIDQYLVTMRERAKDKQLKEELTPSEYASHLRERRARRLEKHPRPVARKPGVAAPANLCPF